MPSPVQQMKQAFDARRNAITNRSALVYAPWVLAGLLLTSVRDRFAAMAPGDWVRLGAAAAALVILSRLGAWALARQLARAEETILDLLRRPAGLRSLNRLRASSRAYRNLRLPDAIQRAIVEAAMRAEREAEERRLEAERERARELARV